MAHVPLAGPAGSVPARPRAGGSSLLSDALRADQVGVWAVVVFVLTMATPLTVVAGVLTTGYGTTDVLGIPLAFVVVCTVLGVFSAGYTAMASKIANAGAFYAFIARGLGPELGVGGAWLALCSYNLLQVGLYGIAGVAAGPVAQQYLHLDEPWWVWALIAWAVTTWMGLRKIHVNGRVLTGLLVAELVAIVVFSVADVAQPGPQGVSFEAFEPRTLFAAGLGSMLVLATLGFVGFEAGAVYSEESRQRARTVRVATYVAVALTGVLYAFAAWAMTVATGPAHIGAASREGGAELVFTLASDRLGGWAGDVGHLLFVTSVAAALVSFHNTIARYGFALGREGVLPPILGRTSRRTSAPIVASGVQSVIGLLVIVVYAVAGWDPLVQLFFWAGTSGGIGVLALLVLTAIAVVRFFRAEPHEASGETTWSVTIAPTLAAIALAVFLVLALTNTSTLLGVPSGHPLTWIIPAAIVGTLVAGVGWARHLGASRPDLYAGIGRGAQSETHRIAAAATAAARATPAPGEGWAFEDGAGR